LHRSLASDPAAGGVTVLLVSPGWVQTDMGGSSAPTAVEESVAGMMRVVARATPADSGRFFDWQGAVVPW
jgi:NAD(P)-dependent dehydrogenase (short-subunit alcohol dehydrogenase family)